jgi:hypothetical protein
MSPFATAGGGFLLAVLWFDLMFDVQAARRGDSGGAPEAGVPEAALASIGAYYARVTTAARPMNRLIAAVMLGTVAALAGELAEGADPAWAAWASLALAAAGIGLAGVRTVPNAVRLGTRRDSAAVQSALARSVLRDHVFCFSAIAALVVLQLAAS